MKKILLTLFLGASLVSYAQNEDNNIGISDAPKHELRIDALEALAVPAIEINYEYIISKYSGAGAAVFFNISDDDFSDYQNFAFTPYYRQYFFNKKDYGARGLFAEGLLQYATGKSGDTVNYLENGSLTVEGDNWSEFGIGFVLGQKWVSRNGFVLELSIGGGRYLLSDDFAPEGFVRGGVLVGYRF